jgi:large subunit ribosomal protein L3
MSTSRSSSKDCEMTVNTRTVKGLLGKKLGMTQGWDADNKLVPITVVEAGENVITQIKNLEKDGYAAIQLAYGAIEPRKVDKPTTGHFAKAGSTPRRFLAEIRTADTDTYTVGQTIGVDIFEVGSKLDVVGTSKGKGFAGVMKRHGFSGIHASHGAHKNHRKPGSVGAGTTPSRVLKGKKMPGRMGTDRVTTLNLTLHGVDLEKGLLLIKGAVPGPKGQLVFVRNAVKETD